MHKPFGRKSPEKIMNRTKISDFYTARTYHPIHQLVIAEAMIKTAVNSI
jgi:hypothetical protein